MVKAAARCDERNAASHTRLGVPSVHIDNAKAAGEAMAHRYRLGHRRSGVITGPRVSRSAATGARSQGAAARGRRRELLFAQGTSHRLGSRCGTTCGANKAPTAYLLHDGMAAA